MTEVAEKLDRRLKEWNRAKAAQVEELVNEIIAAADADALELVRSRQREQEVLDILDES